MFSYERAFKQEEQDLGDKYKIICIKGEGTYGIVFKAQIIGSPDFYAIKKMKLDGNQDIVVKYMKQELIMLQKCTHDNIIKFIESIQINGYLYLVFEYCQMDLCEFKQMYFPKTMPENLILFVLRQLLVGLGYLHLKLKIVHRDIKLENIMLQMSEENYKKFTSGEIKPGEILNFCVIKLIDLGVSKDISQSICQTVVGSPLAMAPEILQNKQYSVQADIYSLGVLLYVLLTGEYPYEGNNLGQQYQKIVKQDATKNLIKEYGVSQEFSDLLSRMLEINPDKRIQIKEIYASILLEIPRYITQHDLKLVHLKTYYKQMNSEQFVQSQLYSKNGQGDVVEIKSFTFQIQQVESIINIGGDKMLEKQQSQEENKSQLFQPQMESDKSYIQEVIHYQQPNNGSEGSMQVNSNSEFCKIQSKLDINEQQKLALIRVQLDKLIRMRNDYIKISEIYEVLLAVRDKIKMNDIVIFLLDTAVKFNLLLLKKLELGEVNNIETLLETQEFLAYCQIVQEDRNYFIKNEEIKQKQETKSNKYIPISDAKFPPYYKEQLRRVYLQSKKKLKDNKSKHYIQLLSVQFCILKAFGILDPLSQQVDLVLDLSQIIKTNNYPLLEDIITQLKKRILI